MFRAPTDEDLTYKIYRLFSLGCLYSLQAYVLEEKSSSHRSFTYYCLCFFSPANMFDIVHLRISFIEKLFFFSSNSCGHFVLYKMPIEENLGLFDKVKNTHNLITVNILVYPSRL